MPDSNPKTAASLIGRSAGFQVKLSEKLLDAFAEISGDRNPLHTQASHAARFGHPHRVAHGMLLASLVSRLVGEHLPGGNILLLSMKISFHHPAYAGEMADVRGVIVEESPATRTLEVRFTIATDREICKGAALVQRLQEAAS